MSLKFNSIDIEQGEQDDDEWRYVACVPQNRQSPCTSELSVALSVRIMRWMLTTPLFMPIASQCGDLGRGCNTVHMFMLFVSFFM